MQNANAIDANAIDACTFAIDACTYASSSWGRRMFNGLGFEPKEPKSKSGFTHNSFNSVNCNSNCCLNQNHSNIFYSDENKQSLSYFQFWKFSVKRSNLNFG